MRVQTDQAKMRVESGGRFEDVPREANKRAILGDPRNDEHVILAGMHAAFLLFHNEVVDGLRRGLAEPRRRRRGRRAEPPAPVARPRETPDCSSSRPA